LVTTDVGSGHQLSPCGKPQVNLALEDAADLADTLTSRRGWTAVAHTEAMITERAKTAAEGLRAAFKSDGAVRTRRRLRWVGSDCSFQRRRFSRRCGTPHDVRIDLQMLQSDCKCSYFVLIYGL